jgi:hypothetical protein
MMLSLDRYPASLLSFKSFYINGMPSEAKRSGVEESAVELRNTDLDIAEIYPL